jgi:acyl carrier protein
METRVATEVTEFIVANYLFGDASRAPGPDESLVEGGVIDSTGVLELIEFVESRFEIVVTEEETVPENLDTISGLTRFILGKRAVAGSAA